MLLRVPGSIAYPAFRSEQSVNAEPPAVFVMPMGQLSATALDVALPVAAVYSVINVGDTRLSTPMMPTQYNPANAAVEQL
jgi:hypothetical protein